MCMTCGCGSDDARIEGQPPAHEHTHADGTRHSHAHGHTHEGHGHDHGDARDHEHGHDHEHARDHEHGHDHEHAHDHEHGHDHGHVHHQDDVAGAAGAAAPGMTQARMVQIERDILAKNGSIAQRNRAWLAERGIFAINLVSSPGSGKTSLLVRTIDSLAGRLPVAVIEGDQQTSFDADRIRATGAPAIQINTGKGCHLDAAMVETALGRLAPRDDSVLMVENVGNLVCPAGFDLGEAHKVVVLSVTEGEDKPLKYPDMFHAASLMLLNKVDLLPHLSFDVELCLAHARRVNPAIEIVQLSATTGQGMQPWLAWIERGAAAAQRQRGDELARMQRRIAELEAQVGRLKPP
jgi:hydrogenase nickel incorporation protein HypB